MKYWNIVILIYIAVLASALCFGKLMMSAEKRRLDEITTVELEANAAAVSGMVDYFIKDLKSQMNYVCNKVEYLGKSPQLDELKDLYNMFIETSIPIVNVGYIKKGHLENVFPNYKLSHTGNEFFKNIIAKTKPNKEINISNTISGLIEKQDGKMIDGFIVIKQVFNINDNSNDYLFMVMDADKMGTMIQLPYKGQNDIKFYVAYPEYNKIFCSPNRDYYNNLLNSSNVENFILESARKSEKKGNIFIISKKDKLYASISKVEDTPFCVVATAPYSDKLNYSKVFIRTILIFTGVVLLILILILSLILIHKVRIKDLKNEISNLKIKIDKNKANEEATKILDNYFDDISDKVESIKKNRH